MKNYLDLLSHVVENGQKVHNRTGVDTYACFGAMLRFDLADGFPLLTTKAVPLRAVIHELLWFLSGSDNVEYLQNNGVHIWDQWALKEDAYVRRAMRPHERARYYAESYGIDIRQAELKLNQITRDSSVEAAEDFLDLAGVPREIPALTKAKGSLGPIYGPQWRRRTGMGPDGQVNVDQVDYVVKTLRENPHSRRILVDAWDPCVLPDETLSPEENVQQGRQALAPCHMFFQFDSHPTTDDQFVEWIEMHRPDLLDAVLETGAASANTDAWCVEHDIEPKALSILFYMRSTDIPIGLPFNVASYAALLAMMAQQTGHVPHEVVYTGGNVHVYENQLDGVKTQLEREPRALPKLRLLRKPGSIFDYKIEDFELVGYDPYPAIKMPVAK